jgi:glycosyltransferase involved in cell wall biosynthesis
MSLLLPDLALLESAMPAPVERLAARSETNPPLLDVVIPVYNEARTVRANVLRLHHELSSLIPGGFRITVADNASVDATWAEARRLHQDCEQVAAVRLPAKGRGRALRDAWLHSDAPVLAYMDVDLSTDLDAVLPLVAPLISGHSDLAIGTRLAHGARVVRGRKRDVISRSYNRILQVGLGVGFSDAQCGFKAITRRAAHALLPIVQDDEWFFDTELLVLAERAGLRIYEVPVDWVDDPDSRVNVTDTAVKDLKGIWRLHRSLPTLKPALGGIGEQLASHRHDAIEAASNGRTGNIS